MKPRRVCTPRSVWSGRLRSFCFAEEGEELWIRVDEAGSERVLAAHPARPGELTPAGMEPQRVRRASYREGFQPYRSPSGRRSLSAGDGALVIEDRETGERVRAHVPAPCLDTLDFYRWIDDETLVWTETGLVVIDATSGEVDVIWDVTESDEVLDVDPTLRWYARANANGLDVGPLAVVDPAGPLAPRVGVAPERLSPEQLRERIIAPRSSPEARGAAERLAVALAEALAAWEIPAAPTPRWGPAPEGFVPLEPVAEPLLELIDRAHREAEVDGHAGVVASSAPFDDAFGAALRAWPREHGAEIDCRREEVLADVDFRSAIAWDLEVPGGPRRGERFAALPNPFALLLSMWATGSAVAGVDERGVELVDLSAIA